jgi:hypothetical protein
MASPSFTPEVDWDTRFHVSPSKANHETNNFHREFFDKPSQTNYQKLIHPKRDHTLTDPVDNRFPRKTKAIKKGSTEAEVAWNGRFHVMYSKDNTRIHSRNRQYFDHPKEKELVNSNMFRSPYANRSISTTTGRSQTARPITSRMTGLYGRNKRITDRHGNLKLRESPERLRSVESRWTRTFHCFSIHNEVTHKHKRKYF